MKPNKLITSKYTKLNFFPLNLYHQLTKAPNVFFLLTLILLSIPAISPFSPYTYMIAFISVLGVSMVKDGIEDYRRHISDHEYNKKTTHVVNYNLENGEIQINDKFVEELDENDFVIVKNDEEIPADMILLSSKNTNLDNNKCHKFCFIETSNLDGEMSYKKKMSHSFLPRKKCMFTKVKDFYCICECDKNFIKNVKQIEVKDTGEDLSDFECKLMMDDNEFLQHQKNVLLRGCRLKSTEQIFGVIVSVGNKTKLSKTARKANQKISVFQMRLFKKLFLVLSLYFCILIVSSIMGSVFLTKNNIQYLYLENYPAKDAFRGTGTSFILYNYLIPISLFVTLEFARFFQGLFIHNDLDMVKNGIKSQCRNTNITEDLGMIECILSDKTGTITKNSMCFKFVHIYGRDDVFNCSNFFIKYRNILSNEEELKKILENSRKDDVILKEILFIFTLLCCNSVEVISSNYEGVSQDEIALLDELRKYDLCLVNSKESSKELNLYGKRMIIETPAKLEFSSFRQRMSVVIKLFNKYYLLTKGSDQKLLNKDSDERKIIDKSSEFRSLVICGSEISKEAFDTFLENYKKSITFHDSGILDKEFQKLEMNNHYFGTTFVEDELQENIRDTIHSLTEAGIKIWIVTGDKKETATKCAINCGLLEKEFDKNKTGAVLKSNDIINSDFLFNQSMNFKNVVIYRASPDHKEIIARKFLKCKKITLAIGDGNNDVLMLETANVGVGIRGKEGTQASLAADISVPDFQCLKKLLLVHGRGNLINFAVISFNSFYKNIFFILIQFYYDFFNGFSGKPVYNYYFLNYFNIFFTSLIPLYISIFNKDHTDEYLLANPRKYKEGRRYLSTKIFLSKLFYAIFKASTVFWLSFGIFYVKDFTNSSGLIGGYKALNNYLSFIVFFTVIIRQTSNITFFVWYAYLAIFISVAAYLVTLFVLQEIDYSQNWAAMNLFSMPVFYVSIILMMGLIYLLDYFYTIYKDKCVILPK